MSVNSACVVPGLLQKKILKRSESIQFLYPEKFYQEEWRLILIEKSEMNWDVGANRKLSIFNRKCEIMAWVPVE